MTNVYAPSEGSWRQRLRPSAGSGRCPSTTRPTPCRIFLRSFCDWHFPRNTGKTGEEMGHSDGIPFGFVGQNHSATGQIRVHEFAPNREHQAGLQLPVQPFYRRAGKLRPREGASVNRASGGCTPLPAKSTHSSAWASSSPPMPTGICRTSTLHLRLCAGSGNLRNTVRIIFLRKSRAACSFWPQGILPKRK
jgi:hypothetical protein